MKHIVTISREAENDLTEIFSWYEDKRKGLGHDFLLQVEAGLRLIEQHPRAFREEYRSVKKHLIKRFPYKIIYLVEQEGYRLRYTSWKEKLRVNQEAKRQPIVRRYADTQQTPS